MKLAASYEERIRALSGRDPRDLAVVVKDLTRSFGDFVAVDHVSFEVARGEIFGFLGPNGAGKTTTIKILCGLLSPSSGEGYVAGWSVAANPEEIKKHIGYMSQKFSLYEDLTVRENIDFFGGIYGLTGAKKAERERWVMEMAGLADKATMLTSELPLGWKQRLALGCAVIHEPPVLFLDEPTSGVDPLSRRSFWELIHSMASRGVTIFVSTHYMEEAEYCNRLALMSRGRIIALGTPAELKKKWMPAKVLSLKCDRIMEASELLKDKDVFSEAAVFGNVLHIVTYKPEEAKTEARKLLATAGISVASLEDITPSLEDVFVTLTSADAD
jgi:ABC-2 type transport system ATP-binding protein